MKLKVSAEYVLSPLAPWLGREQAWVNRIHVLSDGSAVAHLGSTADDGFRDHLVVMRDGQLRVIHEPASLTLARERCKADPHREKGIFPQSFRLQDRVGLLLSDRWAWLFDPLRGDEAVELSIEAPLPTWAHARHENLQGACRPQRCGETVDHRVPVSLQHPDADFDYTGYLSLLDVDVQAARARWSLLDAEGRSRSTLRPTAMCPKPKFVIGAEGRPRSDCCRDGWVSAGETFGISGGGGFWTSAVLPSMGAHFLFPDEETQHQPTEIMITPLMKDGDIGGFYFDLRSQAVFLNLGTRQRPCKPPARCRCMQTC